MKLRIPILLIKEKLRAAHLIFISNDVRFRRKSEAEWKQPWLDMELYNEDGLRTLQQSKAKVKFPSGEILNMDENSLIILKPEKKQEEIDLLSGGVRASRTKILTSSSIIDPKIEAKGPSPDFKTRIKEDKTTLVEVYEGIVDVTAQGKTVTLTKGFGTEVKFRQPPSLPTILPPAPSMSTDMKGVKNSTDVKQPTEKSNLQFFSDGHRYPKSTDTRVLWHIRRERRAQSKVLGKMVNKYHVQISTSYEFTNIILDEVKPIADKVNFDLKKEKLGDGVYYYHYAYVDDLGFEGQYSRPTQFTIDTIPPPLTIDTPKDGDQFDTEFVNIEGTTEPNTSVKVNDKSITSRRQWQVRFGYNACQGQEPHHNLCPGSSRQRNKKRDRDRESKNREEEVRGLKRGKR